MPSERSPPSISRLISPPVAPTSSSDVTEDDARRRFDGPERVAADFANAAKASELLSSVNIRRSSSLALGLRTFEGAFYGLTIEGEKVACERGRRDKWGKVLRREVAKEMEGRWARGGRERENSAEERK